MDQVVSDRSRLQEHLEHIRAAPGRSVILLDADRQIAWIDKQTRARLNGGMQQFAATVRTLDTSGGTHCSLSTHELTINGENTAVCVIHETGVPAHDHGYDAIAAVEAVTRTIIEKLKSLRQTKRTAPRTSDL